MSQPESTSVPSTTTEDTRLNNLLKLVDELKTKVEERGKEGTTSRPRFTPAPVDESVLPKLVQELVNHHTKSLASDVAHIQDLHEDHNLTLAKLVQDLQLWRNESEEEVSIQQPIAFFKH